MRAVEGIVILLTGRHKRLHFADPLRYIHKIMKPTIR